MITLLANNSNNNKNTLEHHSENQGAAGAKFKVIKFQSYNRTTSMWNSFYDYTHLCDAQLDFSGHLNHISEQSDFKAYVQNK